MQSGAKIVALLVLAAAAPRATALGQHFTPQDPFVQADAVDSLVWPEETPASPFPYQSPLGSVYFSADFVAFERAGHGTTNLAAVTTANNVVLTSRSLDFAHEPGLRVLAGLSLGEFVDLEAGYLGLFHWDATQTVRDPTSNGLGAAGNLLSPLSNFGDPTQIGLDFNNVVAARIDTEFNSAECNLRQRLEMPYSTVKVSAIYGTRFMRIRDRFEYRSQSFLPLPTGTANAVDVTAANNMFGVQLGGAMELHIERRAWLSVEIKGIMLHNDASQQTQYTVGPLAGPGTTTTGEGSQGRVCFAGDIQATCVWQFTPTLLGRFGYQAIHLDGVALGADNFGKNAPFMTVGPTEFTNQGSVTFHGPFAGLTLTW